SSRLTVRCLRPITLCLVLFFLPPSTTPIYTLSLHDALPIYFGLAAPFADLPRDVRTLARMAVRQLCRRLPRGYGSRIGSDCQIQDRKSTRLNSSHVKTSYAVFCLKKKTRSICSRCLRSSTQR